VSTILQVCCLLSQTSQHETIRQFLAGDRFHLNSFYTLEELSANLVTDQCLQDCLIVWQFLAGDRPSYETLENLGICLPTVIISTPVGDQVQNNLNNAAIVILEADNLIDLPEAVEKAIALFLKLPTLQVANACIRLEGDRLVSAQQRLSEKLHERLGYLGVYYKRNPRQFWRKLSELEQIEYIQRLQEIYRSLILEYFKDKSIHLNTLIDEFASMCFFADISVAQVLKIHMELMDDFAKQLRLEGRNEEILLDYRITLIDAIAHLCEMYRRSIPKESQR
jgi:circadian clock protein KaiA